MTQVSVSEHAERKATWFELFFDLAVVSALASSFHAYRHHPGFYEGFLCLIMFAAVWVSWTAMT